MTTAARAIMGAAGLAASSGGAGGTVAIVTGNPTSPSTEAITLAGLVSDLGMTPSYEDDTGFAGGLSADVIIFENSAQVSAANTGAWLSPGAPVLVLDGYQCANGNFDFTSEMHSRSAYDGLKPEDSGHALWDGITLDGNGNFAWLTQTGVWTYASTTANLVTGGTVLAQRVRTSDDATDSVPYTVYFVPSGSSITMGTTTEAFLVIGGHFSTSGYWNSNAEQLIKNAIEWLRDNY